MFWIIVLVAIVVVCAAVLLLSRRGSGRTIDRSTGPDSATRADYSNAANKSRMRGGGPGAPGIM